MMERKLSMRLAVALVCIAALLFAGAAPVHASEKSDGKNMKKVLKYYKKAQYSKAQKYARKMRKHAKEKCVATMPADLKQAYLQKVKHYVNKYGIEPNYGEPFVWGYFLSDIDNDKKADLLVELGSCEADVKVLVFRYKAGKVQKVGSTGCGHTVFAAYPKHKGIVLHWGHMGYERLNVLTVKKGKLKDVSYGHWELGPKENFIKMRCYLNSHITYDKQYNPSISYKDLT